MKTALVYLTLLLCHNTLLAQEVEDLLIKNHNIHLKIFGTGEPIIIINGGPGMNSDGFQSLAQILGKTHQAIIYDQRGTGKSKLSKIDHTTITMEAMANDIEAIRNYLHIDKWIVLGHSFGGMLGSYYTAKFPDRVKGLILSSSGGITMDLFSDLNITSRLTTKERDSLNYWSSRISKGDTTYLTRLRRGTYLAPAYVHDKKHVPIIAHRLTQGNPTINELVFQNLRKIGFDCSKELENFEAPVLIIQGKQDIIPKRVAEITKKVMPQSKVVLLDECGHYGWLDQPNLYFIAIHQFLSIFEDVEIVVDKP